MEIEELFCKRYPEYSVNGKPLHPYFDVFEEGYEQAERENEELEKELKDANEKIVHLACNQNKDLKYKLARAKELLNEFMRISKASDEDFEHDYSELIGETEQFLEKVK